MRPLLVLLERLWGPLGASSTALGASWGGSWKGLGSSSGALGDVLGLETRLFSKNEGFASVGARFWKPVRARNGKRVRLETTRI